LNTFTTATANPNRVAKQGKTLIKGVIIEEICRLITKSNLTPELTGREGLHQAFNLANEKQADSAPVQ
jgi:hypothetical protein